MTAAIFTLLFGVPAGIVLSAILIVLWWVATNMIDGSRN